MLFCLTFVYNVATCRFIYSLYVRISGESVKPGMITAPVIHVPENIRAYRALVTANKALVGHFMPGTSVTWKPVPSSGLFC